MMEIRINGKIISESSPPFIIADAGVNYYDTARIENIGIVEAAKKMIESAALSGADAIKFQTYKAKTLASKFSKAYWDTSKESATSQYELFQRYDKLKPDDYASLANYAASQSIIFLSTPFDDEAVDFLDPLMPVYKIASADITNWPFLRRIAKKGKPVFLSTGASTMQEIEEAINLLRAEGVKELAVLHCILNYPTKYEDANLRMIHHLKDTYPDLIVGYSDHTLPGKNMAVLITSYLLGARVIEKHFTLDKTLTGNDHYHAMDGEDLKKLKRNLKFLNLILGAKEKKPLESEDISRRFARRSVVANRGVLLGKIITADDLALKRPGTGIAPQDLEKLIGLKAKRDIEEDEILQFGDFEDVVVAAIIQARMNSTRLHGKVLMEIGGGSPLIWHIVNRLQSAKKLSKIILAIPDTPENDVLEKFARENNFLYFRGSEQDVLSRYYGAAKKFGCDVIVRITSDNPLIDPQIVDQVVEEFLKSDVDYVSNNLVRSFPRGLDTEVMSFRALERAFQNAREDYEREHVTIHIYEHPQNFKLKNVEAGGFLRKPELRWTVDYQEDMEMVKKIYAGLSTAGEIFSAEAAIEFLDRHPEIVALNAHCQQKTAK